MGLSVNANLIWEVIKEGYCTSCQGIDPAAVRCVVRQLNGCEIDLPNECVTYELIDRKFKHMLDDEGSLNIYVIPKLLGGVGPG